MRGTAGTSPRTQESETNANLKLRVGSGCQRYLMESAFTATGMIAAWEGHDKIVLWDSLQRQTRAVPCCAAPPQLGAVCAGKVESG